MSIIFANGRVYLGAGRFAHALVSRHGRVVATGDVAAVRREHPDAKLIDLRNGLMLPGFTDSHCHFLWWAVHQLWRLDLGEERTLDAALAKIDAYATALPEGAWILGGRFDKNLWGRWPTRDELDRVSRGHAAVLDSKDGHSRWANTLALRAARIGKETATPEGGEIERDASGAPSGILRENALRLVDPVIPLPTDDERVAAVREGQRRALERGIVGVHDLDRPMRLALAAFHELHARSELVLRVGIGIEHELLDEALALGIRGGLGDEWLRFSNLKIYADGALGSQTAALEEPYEGTHYRGVLRVEPERLARDVRRAAGAGIAVAIHAIGDRAVRVALDAIEGAGGPRDGLRHRLEHVQLVRDEDVARFARLGVVASMQPIHATSDRDIADRHWRERCRRAYPWKSLRDAGVALAFGSDAPVEPIDPLLGMYAAVARKRPTDDAPWYAEQRLSVEDAIAGYTIGAARALSREHELGTLEVGKWCDAVVLDRDIFRAPAEALLETKARATITAGVVRHDAGLG